MTDYVMIRRRLALRASIDNALERYLAEEISGHDTLASAPRDAFLDEVMERFDALPEMATMAQAWAILARQLAGHPDSSRQLREALTALIGVLDGSCLPGSR